MKYNLRTYFAAWALLLSGAASLTGCTGDDDFGRIPEGSIPLSIGSVGVAGVETAGGSTRAAITENASGFTGIRKSRFVNTDALALTLSNDGGTTTTGVTATLTGGQWVLNPAKNYILPGTTTIKATYTPTATSGMKADVLEATTYTLEGQTVTFGMKHANAMIDITYTAGVVPTGITVTAHNGTADETLATAIEEEADGMKHFRTIASPGTVKSLTAVINGKNYVATLATPLAVAANKCYPIALTFKENVVTATVGTATLNWGTGGAGELYLPGYDRYIGTPEDLAQFAYDVNNDLNGSRTAKVLQTADIDLAQLKTAAEATAATGKTYTYTAIAENWVPVGTSGDFTGTYNGNGYTISNMKITSGVSGKAGLFGSVVDAILTGIHLRNVSITANGVDCGSLCVKASGNNTRISLCSVTGNIDVQEMNYATGGFIAIVDGYTNITRCTASVDIHAHPSTSGFYVGGFAGRTLTTGSPYFAGCSYNGDINCRLFGTCAGFMAGIDGGDFFACSTSGTITNSVSSSAPYIFAEGRDATITSCYSTMTAAAGETLSFGSSSSSANMTYVACAWTGTQSTAIAGVTGDVAVADLYDKITAGGVTSHGLNINTSHWSAADGYTTTEVSDQWYASGVWKDNGTAAPTVNMAYEGGAPLYNGQRSNLLALSGQTAYWVAPVNAATNVAWTAVNFATVCPEGWHVPTNDEFVAMGCLGTSTPNPEKQAIVSVAFPVGSYWSSTAETDLRAYFLSVTANNVGVPNVEKASLYNVRCVRKK